MISLGDTPKHAYRCRSIAQLPLSAATSYSRSLMGNHNVVARAIRIGRVVIISWCRPTMWVVASTHVHPLHNPILRL
ncbi:hypothetical protein GW17_00026156 [Ensete ventricosum]|nr:hypothetical protein GW17_00026156 [Ensete ventricosum]RZR81607.1 hypothetical protein BHM03_00007874 [Ensete ventricosum]